MIATTIAEVIDKLSYIVANAVTNNNRAGYFAAMYKRVTVAVSNNIQQGYFDDNPRMEKLDVIFANRYLQAYDNYYTHNTCSPCWKIAFDTCNNWQPMVLHHLLTGMNAHIGLDLGIATATVSPGADLLAIHNDFNKINTILGSLVHDIKADLYAMWPVSKFIARLHTDKLENDIAGFSMTIARDAAWQSALDYTACNSPAAQQQYITNRDADVTAFTNKLLHPGAFIQTATSVLRAFEFGTIPEKINRLNS